MIGYDPCSELPGIHLARVGTSWPVTTGTTCSLVTWEKKYPDLEARGTSRTIRRDRSDPRTRTVETRTNNAPKFTPEVNARRNVRRKVASGAIFAAGDSAGFS